MPEPITPDEIASWEASHAAYRNWRDGDGMALDMCTFMVIADRALPRLLAERTRLIERVAELETFCRRIALEPSAVKRAVILVESKGPVHDP